MQRAAWQQQPQPSEQQPAAGLCPDVPLGANEEIAVRVIGLTATEDGSSRTFGWLRARPRACNCGGGTISKTAMSTGSRRSCKCLASVC